jgi:hypothetical protein
VTHLPAIHAEQMRSVVNNDELASTASEIRRRLAAVAERVAESYPRADGQPRLGETLHQA